MKKFMTALFLASALLVGCGDGENDAAGDGDTATVGGLEVDTAGDKTQVAVDQGPKTYNFVGTATSLDKATMMVTVKHENVENYKPAGSSQFKLADSGMAEYVEMNTPVEYTIEVVGDQALVTAMETADEDDAEDAAEEMKDSAK